MAELSDGISRALHRRVTLVAFLVGIVMAAVVAALLTRDPTSGTVRLSTAGTASAPGSTMPAASSPTTGAAPVGTDATLPATTVVPLTTTTLPLVTTAPATLPPAPTTLPPTTTSPSASSTSVPDSTAMPGAVITGTVDDSSGQPVAGAYVIGLDSLTVARTDASGQFTMSCQLTVGGISGDRAEPLVASAWLLPVEPTGQGSYALGRNTTDYSSPPTAAGLGYTFSGGSLDAADASIVTCGGPPPHFVLGPGGGVDIELLGPTGAPLTGSAEVPVDNLYLPGLGDHAALETAPVSGGHQLVQELGAGTLRIDGTTTSLSCQGAGVVPDPSVAGADVTVTPGTTTKVTCTT